MKNKYIIINIFEPKKIAPTAQKKQYALLRMRHAKVHFNFREPTMKVHCSAADAEMRLTPKVRFRVRVTLKVHCRAGFHPWVARLARQNGPFFRS